MEPITIILAATRIFTQTGAVLSFMLGENLLSSIAVNILSNRVDTYGIKQYKKFTERIDEPANHDIQKAVRRSYLKALLLAVRHERAQVGFLGRTFILDTDALSYIKKQIKDLEGKHTAFPLTDFDEQYQHLFRTQKETSEATLQAMTDVLKDSVISELREQGIDVTERLEGYIRQGWDESTPSQQKNIDWYKLVCAFFAEELKINDRLSKVIQTEYLDNIAQHIQAWDGHLENLYQAYEEQIDVCNEILEVVTEILAVTIGTHKTVNDIDGNVKELPDSIRQIVKQELQRHASIEGIPDIRLSRRYQQLQNEIEDIIVKEEEIKVEIEDLKAELTDEIDTGKQERKKRVLNRAEVNFIEINGQKNEKGKELETFIKEVTDLANYFNASNITTPRFVNAKMLFEAGEYEEAGKVLDEKEIYEDIKQTKEKLSDYAQELVLKAKIKVINKATAWYEEADRLYKDAINTFESYDTCFAYGCFLQEHRQFLQAVPLYDKCLLFASDEVQKANSLHNLGFLQINIDRFESAEENYNEVLEIYRSLEDDNTQTYAADLARTLYGLGVLQSLTNRPESADVSYNKALEIIRQLAENNPQTYGADVAKMLQALGRVQSLTNRFESAENSYNEALEINRQLAEINPKAYRADVATALVNLGNFHVDTNRFESAEENYKESLEINRQLAEINPQTYSADVATALVNLGNLQADTNRLEPAEESYKEALEIYRVLAENNPLSYRADVATVLVNLGILEASTNRPDAAEESYSKALEIIRQLAESNPQRYRADVANTLSNFGILQANTNRFDFAEQSYYEALEIRRQLAENNPLSYRVNVASTLVNLGILQASTNRFDSAEDSYKEALEIRRQLAESNPESYRADVANTLNNLGILYTSTNRFESAEACYKEALEIYRVLVKNNPLAYRGYVATVLVNLGVLQADTNHPDSAEESFIESLEIRRQLAENNPQAYLSDIANTVVNLGILQVNTSRPDSAEKSFSEALEIYRVLAEINPQAYCADVGNTLNNLGNLQADANRPGSAEENWKEAFEIYRQLADNNCQTYHVDVVRIAYNLALLYKKDIVNKTQSVFYAMESVKFYAAIENALPDVTNMKKEAENILEYWV